MIKIAFDWSVKKSNNVYSVLNRFCTHWKKMHYINFLLPVYRSCSEQSKENIIYAQRKIISTNTKTYKIRINFERTNTIELKTEPHSDLIFIFAKPLFIPFLFFVTLNGWWCYYCFSKSLLLFRLMTQSFYWKILMLLTELCWRLWFTNIYQRVQYTLCMYVYIYVYF